jgi:hypothetical protein
MGRQEMKNARILGCMILCMALLAIAGCSDGTSNFDAGLDGVVEEITLDEIENEVASGEMEEPVADTEGVEEGSGKGGGGGSDDSDGFTSVIKLPVIPPVVGTKAKPDPIAPQDPVRINPGTLVAGGIQTAPVNKVTVKVETLTADVEHGETDMNVVLYLCPDKADLPRPSEKHRGKTTTMHETRCSAHSLGKQSGLADDEYLDLFERGQRDEFILDECKVGVNTDVDQDGEYEKGVGGCNFERMRYYQIYVHNPDGHGYNKKNLIWMLQEIKLTLQWRDAAGELLEEKVQYWNPCLNAEFPMQKRVDLSDDDTQFCVVTKTKDEEYADTDKDIYFSYQLPMCYGKEDLEEDHKCEGYTDIIDVNLDLGAGLSGSNYRYKFDDFRRGMRNVRGIRIYDKIMVGNAGAKVAIWKNSTNDDWVLEELEVYAFHPGKSFWAGFDDLRWFNSLIKSWDDGKKFDEEYNGEWMRLDDGIGELPDLFDDMPIISDGIH